MGVSRCVSSARSASGAPKGSIYHQFDSVDDVLAAVWIRAVRRSQAAFLDALDEEDPRVAAVQAALSIHDFAVEQRADAQLLGSLRRADLLRSRHAPIQVELEELNRPLEAALSELARRLFGRATRTAVQRTACAVVDIPQGAIRRHLIEGSEFPRTLRGQIAAASRAALD